MILTKVTIENFNIFYGPQHLDLTKGLYIIHGENGRGKSTFLNAITWALFGEYLNRQGEPVTPKVMINREAAREGTTSFRVRLEVEDGHDKIRIKRSFDTSEENAGMRLSVEKNGNMLNQEDSEALLRGLIDRDVSRFFLFDGEELRRYEELLFAQSNAGAEVRHSIEHILGLPALTNAVRDLEIVADEFASKVTKAARKEKKVEQAAKAAEQLELEIKDAEADRADLDENRSEQKQVVKLATEVLQQYQSSQENISKKAAIESEIQALRQSRQDMEAILGDSLRGVWKDVLAVAVAPRRDELKASIDEENERIGWKKLADELELALSDETCDRCGQPIHGKSRELMEARLEELRAKPQPSGTQHDAGTTLTQLAAIAPTDQTTTAIKTDKSISKDGVAIASLSEQLADLSAEIEGIPEEEIRSANKDRDAAQKLIGTIDEKIQEKDTAIAKLREELTKARNEVEKHSTLDETSMLSKQRNLASDLASVFDSAKDRFRDEMRVVVGSDASSLFTKLTSDKELEGLQIEENYGLTTLGPGGEEMPSRSAGQEQVVAFSLIGALNKNASRRAPVIMDTPLSRLGRQHKENVLTHLENFGEQVILLIHDDEVPEDLLETIRTSIVAEFELHKESLFRTRIQKKEAP